MKTLHQVIFGSSSDMSTIADSSVQLTVTSPPYPMIQMWDAIFSQQNLDIKGAVQNEDGNLAFELMHQELDKVWNEVYRVTAPGGIVCINIGDATRTINNNFSLYSNHSRILNYCTNIGFSNLPNLIWRKQTNAPNKFMGSGMMPPGAYVTLEHEYILIFRKGGRREFRTGDARRKRMESSFFWEERNSWFSDIWDFKGTGQNLSLTNGRDRSGAFPFELAYRLINMFSIKDDLVLDPFVGTGTTVMAAAASCRNSVGYELEERLSEAIAQNMSDDFVDSANDRIRRRFIDHEKFVKSRHHQKGPNAFKHVNSNYGFPVVTSQETQIVINYMHSIARSDNPKYEIDYFSKAILDPYAKDSLFFSQAKS